MIFLNLLNLTLNYQFFHNIYLKLIELDLIILKIIMH